MRAVPAEGATLRGVNSERWATPHRAALLGMVPLVTLLLSFAIAPLLAAQLGAPEWLGVIGWIILVVAGFFVSRAILRRGFAQRAL